MHKDFLTQEAAGPGPGDLAVLVGVQLKDSSSSWTLKDSLDELAKLAETAGLSVAGVTWQKLGHPDPRTWIGSGKVREVKELIDSCEARYVLFDGELSPGQQRKLEAGLGDGIRIIDRTRLILDIFGQHASSREGKLQVELAQYQYLLPRLAGMRAGLSQQVGGAGAGPVGLRGPGETQLELDRRQARRRIAVLRRGLEEIRGQRQLHREGRERSGLPVIALVGYTNAGKSSLMNALTDAGVLVQDKLFATLDPATRRLSLPGGRDALLTDTVGFIRKLPHELVAAFRATLEGIEEASLIVHVVDSSHPHATEQIAAVESVLGGLKVSATPRLVAWNKVDLLADPGVPAVLGGPHEHSLSISARTGKGVKDLLARMEALLDDGLVDVRLLIPYGRYELVRLVYDRGSVSGQVDVPEGVRLRARVPDEVSRRLAEFHDTKREPDVSGA
jgi:GTP-binding protein HflX